MKILKKTGGKCTYCGMDLMSCPAEANIEHLLPKVHGGRNSIDNLVPSCRSCNASKKSLIISDDFDLQTMRMRLALRESRLHGIITGAQAVRLSDLGIDLGLVCDPLWFEVNCPEICKTVKEMAK